MIWIGRKDSLIMWLLYLAYETLKCYVAHVTLIEEHMFSML